MARILITAIIILACAAACPTAQTYSSAHAVSPSSYFRHSFLWPLGSVFVPGLGQWVNGATGAGFAFFGTSLGTAAVAANTDSEPRLDDRLPRTREGQLHEFALQASFDAGLLSAYDSFRRSLPGLQAGQRYRFLENTTSTRRAFAAPFRFGFLGKATTWILLSIPVAIIAASAIDDNNNAISHLPFQWHDAVYAGGTSYGAGVTEEAFFRGFLFPVTHELWGERFWLANTSQALLFGAAHLASNEVPWPQFILGGYWGWLTRRNDWDLEEAIFQHFWWDAVLITGILLLDDGDDPHLAVTFPTIRF